MQYFPEPLARVAIAQIGTKRTCVSCAVRFYDLARVPASCPKCGAQQPPPRSRAAPADRLSARRPGRFPAPGVFPAVAPEADVETEPEIEAEDDEAAAEDADEAGDVEEGDLAEIADDPALG